MIFIRMDSVHLVMLRTAVAAFKVLVLLHLSTVLAAGVGSQSQLCGDDHLEYSNVNGNTFVYVNGDLVSKDLYCKVIRYHLPNDCTFESVIGSGFCQLDSESAELNKKRVRKLLRKELMEESNGQDVPQKDKDDELSSVSTAKRVGIAATGVLSLCCVFLCPCFYRKTRATSHSVLEKDISSGLAIPAVDSVSSAEAISVHDKVPPSPMRVPPSPSRFSNSPKLNRLKSIHLSMSQVVKATRNFSPSLQIGEGGFGVVYKAHLEDGQVVAIKRAKKEHFDNLRTEFSSEVEVLAKIDHRNLVKLLGYVDRGTDRLIITEFVPNGTLREHLDGQRGKILDFNQRLEISIDVAHALTYLHLYTEKQIIHRDVKSSNILLTESMRAKVADFGFARLGPMDSDHTHISTKVKGTVGYLDPEYMRTYQLTSKSDVYSFGILLLEILTGRRPVEIKKPPDERVTVRWAFGKYSEGLVAVLVDPLMEEPVAADVLNKMFALAFECAAPIRSDRPDMKSVGEQLWGIRADYLRSAKKG